MSGALVTVDANQPPGAQARADLVLGSPYGRLFLAGCLGYEFGDTLYEQPGDEVRAVVGAAVARGEWRRLLDLDEFGLLTALAGAHPDVGSVIAGDEGAWALLAHAAPPASVSPPAGGSY